MGVRHVLVINKLAFSELLKIMDLIALVDFSFNYEA